MNFIVKNVIFLILSMNVAQAEFKPTTIKTALPSQKTSSIHPPKSYFSLPSFSWGSANRSDSPTEVARSLSPENSKSEATKGVKPEKASLLQSITNNNPLRFLSDTSSQKSTPNPITSKATTIIDTWLQDYPESMGENVYAQANLHDEIMNEIFVTNKVTKSRELLNENINLSDVKNKLQELITKYANEKNVKPVLNTIINVINQYEQAHLPIALTANRAISALYPRDQAISILTMMHIKPEFDPETGALINTPSIEMIQEQAHQNPTQATFNALNAAKKAIRMTKTAIGKDNSFGSKKIKDQLKKYDAQLNQTLTNPHFDTYKSFAVKNMLDATGLSDVTIHSLLESTKSGLQKASQAADQITAFKNDALLNASGYAVTALTGYARMGVSGAFIDTVLYHIAKENIPSAVENLKKMTLGEFIETMSPSEKTSILNAQATMDRLNSNTISLQGELTKIMKGSNKQQIAQAQLDANNEIKNYYYQPSLQSAVFKLMKTQPIFDQKTGTITNMPSIETIISQAEKNPSQESYDALQAAIKATDIALSASKYDLVDWMVHNSLKVEQLYLYKDQLTQSMQKPAMIRYKKIINRVTDFTTTIIPQSTDIIKATGILDTTFDQLSQGNTHTNSLINTGLQQTGMGNITLGQALTSAKMIPATPQPIAE